MDEQEILDEWGSESDIQKLVSAVISDIICAIGLKSRLKFFAELSVFRLRADIWVVMKSTGLPVGVIEVKKPNKEVLNSRRTCGQIYDYLLRLKSFYGLEHVFGIVTTYDEWRFFWLPECDHIAASSDVTVSEISQKQWDVSNEKDNTEVKVDVERSDSDEGELSDHSFHDSDITYTDEESGTESEEDINDLLNESGLMYGTILGYFK